MDRDKRDINATRAAIIAAAKKLIAQCSDPSEVTSRAITKEAGVNLAMINYIFGSREALFFEVFSDVKAKALKDNPAFSMILASDKTPKEKLALIHFESVRMMIEYYKYSKAVIKHILINREINAERESVSFIKAHFGDRKTEEECRLIAYELSAVHELLVLRYEEIKETLGIDLTDENVLRKTVEENINRFLD